MKNIRDELAANCFSMPVLWLHSYLFRVAVVILASLSMFSCADDESAAVGFETSEVRRTESDSVYSVRIYLGKVTALTTVTIDVYGSAALDGDYEITIPVDSSSDILPFPGSSTASQQIVSVQAGASYAEVFFKIIDDPYVEPRAENIYFRISDISNDNVFNDLKNQDYQFVIIDNDVPPGDAMRVDLSWQLGDGISVTQGNFDMYLASNVVVTNGQVTSHDLVEGVSSTNEKGFESYMINSAVPDGKYYVMIRYMEGTYDADTELILSKGNTYSRATARISGSSTGKDFFFGPITKSGSTYSRVAPEAEVEPGFIY